MLTTVLHDFRRLRVAIVATLLVGALLLVSGAHGAQRTETRTFTASGADDRSLTFRLVAVTPASIRRARLIAGRRVVEVPPATVRRGARRGVLRLPRSILAVDRAALRVKPATRAAKLVLTLGDHGAPAPAPGDAPRRDGGHGRSDGASGVAAPPSRVDGAAARPDAGRGRRLAGVRLYVEPDSSARRQADLWRASRPLDAAAMERIAAQPQAAWIGEWNGDVRAAVDRRVDAATAAEAVPILVAYNIPQRDCGSHSAGGAASAAAYRSWIRELAGGLDGRHALVILEPDALAGLDCLAAEDRATRLALLADAVSVLEARGSVATYVDAGHSAWRSAEVMAARLRAVGISQADGFSLNVSNFNPTDREAAYGATIAKSTGDKPFVIDTSRNGPAAGSPEWCNPTGRALGTAPTTDTGRPLVEAYLWIKRPGESDGSCNGGPPAGAWWPEYALGLVERAG